MNDEASDIDIGLKNSIGFLGLEILDELLSALSFVLCPVIANLGDYHF